MKFNKHYFLIACLFYIACSTPTHVINKEGTSLKLSTTFPNKPDSEILSFIAPYSDSLNKTMNEVLIISEQPLIKNQPEGLLGNWVADIVLKQARKKYKQLGGDTINVCLLNNGGLRTALPKGEITHGKIFELMPFENELVVATLSGDKMKELFEYIASTNGAPLSGATLAIKNGKPDKININQTPFNSMQAYKVLSSDYLIAGGDKMYFFKNALHIDTLNYLLRDAIINELIEQHKAGKSLVTKLDGRIYNE